MFLVPLKVKSGTAWVRGCEIMMVWPKSDSKCDVYFYNQSPLEVLEAPDDVMVKWYASEIDAEDDEDDDDDSED